MTTIAIVGHTNAGKTTMIRTMTKGVHGVIRDEAGTTTVDELVEYPALHASFIDCPGFRRASVILDLLQGEPGWLERLDTKYEHERVALTAIQRADAVVYVASVETTPEPSHEDELDLVRHVNPRVIAVLNKKRQQAGALGTRGLAKREGDWRRMLAEHQLGLVYDFDSHWDRFSKLAEVYRGVEDCLSDEKRVIFARGLKRFAADLRNKQDTISRRAAACVRVSRSEEKTAETEAHGHDAHAARAKLRSELAQALTGYLAEFVDEARDVYAISVDTESDREFELSASEFKKRGDRVAAIATHSGVGLAIGTVIGLGIGALLGPVGAAAGAALGAKIGAAIGAGAGVFTGAVVETNTTIRMTVSASDLREIALFCLAATWCVTHQGFGNDAAVVAKTFAETRDFVRKEVKAIRQPDWKTASEREMTNWFRENLATLEL